MQEMKHQLTILVLGEVTKELRGQLFQPHMVKSAPHYFGTSVPHQIVLGEEKLLINDREITFYIKGYQPDILLVQTNSEVSNVFSQEIFELENKILDQSYKILKSHGGIEEFSEIYSVFEVSGYKGEPEQFLEHAAIIAALLKSEEKIALDKKEIEHTLSAQIKYANHDLAIIDWDGAFLFDHEGDFESTIELLTLANVQLLRHRTLDRQLDERLEKMAKLVKKPEKKFFFFKEKELIQGLKEIIKDRMASISQFHALEREIKLIGDWYSARLYDLTAKKFKIDEWRESIKDKMDSIEDVYSIVVENFSVSSKERAEWIQIIGFFILQIGWFVLIVLEFFYFTR